MGTVKAWLFKTTETDPRGVRRWHSQAVLGFLFSSQTLYLEIMSNIQKSCKNKNSIKNRKTTINDSINSTGAVKGPVGC